MNLEKNFKNTYHSLNPFRKDFEHNASKSMVTKLVEGSVGEYKSFKSWKGRVYCLIKLALSPISIPLTILKKIFKLAEAVFGTLAQFVRFGQHSYLSRLLGHSIYAVDRLASLLICPLNMLVARIRYLLGIIHPQIVFS